MPRGIGVDQNLAESYKWFALAAAQGDQDAAKKREDVAGRLDPAVAGRGAPCGADLHGRRAARRSRQRQGASRRMGPHDRVSRRARQARRHDKAQAAVVVLRPPAASWQECDGRRRHARIWPQRDRFIHRTFIGIARILPRDSREEFE